MVAVDCSRSENVSNGVTVISSKTVDIPGDILKGTTVEQQWPKSFYNSLTSPALKEMFHYVVVATALANTKNDVEREKMLLEDVRKTFFNPDKKLNFTFADTDNVVGEVRRRLGNIDKLPTKTGTNSRVRLWHSVRTR